MEQLFVVNRYNADKPEINANDHLTRVLKRIEKNKKIRAKQKEHQKEKKQFVAKAIENKLKRREKKTNIVKPPEDDNEFIDKDILELEETNEPKIKKPKVNVKDLTGFTVLGAENFKKKQKVRRVLPKWLANPTEISTNLQNLETKVSELKALDKKLRKKLKENGVKYFFPVQSQVIPWLLQSNKHASVLFPRDVCVSAPTGSGKTLAFVLPVIQALLHHMVKKIRALVILPTQDLALQVFKTFRKYVQDTNINVCLITGQSPIAMEEKKLVYHNEAFGYLSKTDILVCTAGRLVDHLTLTKGFDLRHLEFLVIDEADRVLDSVQNDWLYHLEKHINQEDQNHHQSSKIFNLFSLKRRKPPQKLLFSATLSQDPEKLEKLSLFQPKLFMSVSQHEELNSVIKSSNAEDFVGRYTKPKELVEKFVVCSMELKPLVLYKLIKMKKLTKTMIFTHSLDSAHRLWILLRSLFKNELKIEEISSNLEAKNRNHLIEEFSKNAIDLLVCTDSLARGIDLPGVQCVISYSCPKYLITYIHRAGRTARAGELGLTITMLHTSQVGKFQALVQQNDIEEIKIPEETLEPLAEQYQEALSDLKKAVDEEEKRDLLKTKAAKRPINRKKKKGKHVTSNV